MKPTEFNKPRRNFLRAAAKTTAALSVVAAAPVAALALIESNQPSSEHIIDLDINCMYTQNHFPEGSLWLDTDNDKLHRKVKLNEQYGKFGGGQSAGA